MKKNIFLTILLAAVVLLTGCIAGYDDGRQVQHKEIRLAEEATSQEFLKAKRAELEASKTKTQNPTLRVVTYQADGQTVASVIEADIAPSIEAATGGNKHDSTYGVDLKRTAAPRGEVAENLDAGGNLIVSAASSPGGIIYATAKGVAAGIKESGGGGTHLAADEMNIDGSFNKSEAVNIGSGSSNASTTSGKSAAASADKVTSTVDPAHWADCTTTEAGAATIDEINACLVKDYNYPSTICDGGICIDGKPYSGGA